jgi:hypothetical protein
MKVIDKTPYQNENGQFGPLQRLQAIMEHGMSWQSELEAQKTVIAQLDRVLEKGFTLIRNLNLENSQIIEPLILVGPPGVFVIYVTPLTGFFEAKGDEWNAVRNDRPMPAQVNLLKRTGRLARALQVYLNRQGMYLPGMVEPVLMASSTAIHIEQLRPAVRVVMSDAVKQFGASLLQARAVLKADMVNDLVDHIINPQLKPGPRQAEPVSASTAVPTGAPTAAEAGGQSPSRARAIFHAAEEAKPFDPADLSFAFDENSEGGVPDGLRETSPSQLLGPAPRRGLRPGQWLALGVMLLLECAVLGGFAYLILFRR